LPALAARRQLDALERAPDLRPHWEVKEMDIDVIEGRESQVRTYFRSFPALLDVAQDFGILDTVSSQYLDFLASAGSLNDGLCFRDRLIVETCGPRGHALKLLPPLTILRSDLKEGIGIVAHCLTEALHPSKRLVRAV
jgi:4-aminobutyrate aminotransferase-like enzyme